MKLITPLLASLAASFSAYAQPTLTVANSNPVIGDVFYNHRCNLGGISVGISGIGVTWNYSTLTDSTMDTTTVVSCISTPYCDSFAASTFAEAGMPDSEYVYFTADASMLTVIGQHSPVSLGGPGFVYFNRPFDYLGYPIAYGTSWNDTDLYSYAALFAASHIFETMNNLVDGYGTLVTPSGTYTNVLRIHSIDYVTDSDYTYGPVAVYHSRQDFYYWYQPYFHFPLLMLETDNDSATGAIIDVSCAQYKNNYAVSGLSVNNINKATISVFPNPSKDVIHISSNNEDITNAQISIFEVTGREVLVPADKMMNQNPDEVTIPISFLPEGIYILKVRSQSGTVIRKIQVVK